MPTNKEYAYYGIVVLVDHIKNNENSDAITMTYMEFSDKINKLDENNSSLYFRMGGILDDIGKFLLRFDPNAPPITILIIKEAGLPDDSVKLFCPEFGEADDSSKKYKILEEQTQLIKEYLRAGKLDKFLSEMKSNPDFAALPIKEDSSEVVEAQRIKKDDFLHMAQDDDNSMVAEGVTSKVHYAVENRSRNSSNARKKKERSGYNCKCCGFNFRETYGELGGEYIECHHIKPIAKLDKKGENIGLEDLAVLCANCHRMIHRLLINDNEKYEKDYPSSITDLQKLIEEQKAKA